MMLEDKPKRRSNYENVCRSIIAHPLWVEYMKTVRARINTWRVLRMDFSIVQGEAGGLAAKPYFRHTYDGAPKEYDCWNNEYHQIQEYEIEIRFIMPSDEMIDIVLAIFKSDGFHTYGYEFGERKPKSDKKRTVWKEFISYLNSNIQNIIGTELSMAHARCREEMRVLHTVGFEDRKAASIERQGIDAIKKQLLKFRHLGTEVLKTAFHEFVCEDILLT